MPDQIKEIATRIRELREIEGLSVDELAGQIGVSATFFSDCESGNADIPISFLLAVGNRFGVEVTTLLTGGEARLRQYTLTRAGKGPIVNRRKEHEYQSLAFHLAAKIAQPFLVTAHPVSPQQPLVLNAHEGQEFNYVLEGQLRVVIDGKELLLGPGDSLYYNSGLAHAMQASGDKPAKFLAIVM